jgi:hypothetical protein
MIRNTVAIVFLSALLATGCAQKYSLPEPVADSATAVDASLPKDAQAKQDVIRTAMFSLQEGYPVERLKTFLPGVKFNETQSRFLDGARYLDRWNFNGQPSGDEIPVTLFFSGENAGSEESTKVDRVYVVKKVSGRYTVTRK